MARIVVTRPTGREEPLVTRLRDRGHEVVHTPLVALEPLGDEPVDVGGYDWVVLTSVTGARELRRRMRGTPRRVAAIGLATAEAFGGADVVATTSTQEGLLEALPPAPGRVLFAGAEGARQLLPNTLGADVVALYRTVELTPAGWPACDLVVLATKAMHVESAASAIKKSSLLGKDTPVLSIQNGLGGPETAASILGKEKVMVGVVGGFGASIRAPGHAHHNGMELVRLGEFGGPITPRLKKVEEAAPSTCMALVARTTRSQAPASFASVVAWTLTVRSLEVPSRRSPFFRIASTCAR